ncbi:hypothetical protein HK102_009646 [Quaeritorhiza haematococci]|nr:hypothetical protein HK102_009646 [Quaeritorhiza haematococci]
MQAPPRTLFDLLATRPTRITYENLENQTISATRAAPGPSRPSPFFLHKCRDSSIDLTPVPLVAQLTVDRCIKVIIHVGSVVSSIALIACSNAVLRVSGLVGTVTVDDCEGCIIEFMPSSENGGGNGSDAGGTGGCKIFTSGSSGIKIQVKSNGDLGQEASVDGNAVGHEYAIQSSLSGDAEQPEDAAAQEGSSQQTRRTSRWCTKWVAGTGFVTRKCNLYGDDVEDEGAAAQEEGPIR